MNSDSAATAAGLGGALLAIARNAIASELGIPPDSREPADFPCLDEPAATFVTLTRGGNLRGCIGSLAPRRSLRDDVRENARAAAFGDPRFPPLAQGEFRTIRIEVSLLDTPEPLHCSSEEDVLAALRPGIDGVVLQEGFHRATFLPQVWEALPDPREFLRHLKAKAGIPPDSRVPGPAFSRYTVTKWKEP